MKSSIKPVIKIDAYRCSDGSVFESRLAAMFQQTKINMADSLHLHGRLRESLAQAFACKSLPEHMIQLSGALLLDMEHLQTLSKVILADTLVEDDREDSPEKPRVDTHNLGNRRNLNENV